MNQSNNPAIWNVLPSVRRAGVLNWLLATFQAPDGTFDEWGTPGSGYVDVAGLTLIPCMAPPPSEVRVQATEVRALAEITATELHHVILDGYYPAADQGWRGDGTPAGAWRLLIGDNDGTGQMVPGTSFAYDIMGVEASSFNQETRVQVKLTTI